MHINFTEPHPRNYRRKYDNSYDDILTNGINTKRNGKTGVELNSSGGALFNATASSNGNGSEDISHSSTSQMRYQILPSDADLSDNEYPRK